MSANAAPSAARIRSSTGCSHKICTARRERSCNTTPQLHVTSPPPTTNTPAVRATMWQRPAKPRWRHKAHLDAHDGAAVANRVLQPRRQVAARPQMQRLDGAPAHGEGQVQLQQAPRVLQRALRAVDDEHVPLGGCERDAEAARHRAQLVGVVRGRQVQEVDPEEGVARLGERRGERCEQRGHGRAPGAHEDCGERSPGWCILCRCTEAGRRLARHAREYTETAFLQQRKKTNPRGRRPRFPRCA